MNGVITDIHRSSVVDGPGIRTTVFLKGCPLTCVWCHNPETQEEVPQLGYNKAKCTGCGQCVGVCPQSALSLDHAPVSLNRSACDNCLACTNVCPSEALFTYGRNVSVDEVMTEVLKDKPYYEESGGGVTISGGEPMKQTDFTIALLKACKSAGIHTCLDTTGIGAVSDYQKTMGLVDLYLFDYKATDPETHRHLTGASLEKVMRGLDMLLGAGAAVHLRCPMVPGLNDTDEHLEAIARLSNTWPGLKGIDILTWHTMGAAKYGYLGYEIPEGLPTGNTEAARKAHYSEFFGSRGVANVTVY